MKLFLWYAIICAIIIMAAWMKGKRTLTPKEIAYALLIGWILAPAILLVVVCGMFGITW